MRMRHIAGWVRKFRWRKLLLHQKLLFVFIPIILLPYTIGTGIVMGAVKE